MKMFLVSYTSKLFSGHVVIVASSENAAKNEFVRKGYKRLSITEITGEDDE